MGDINITVNDEIVNIDIVDEPVLVNVVNSPGVPGAPGQGVPVGGTTGQVLAKNSNTNYDTEWVDINAVPYTGATANVDLGEYELKAGQVEFDQTPTGTAGVGVMRWNDSDGTLDLGLKGGNVTLQLGQEQVARVVNKSGVNLLESAYQVVKVTDAQGQRLAVDLAQGNNDANSTDTIGIVTENIDNNQEGFITTSGIVRNINTTGSLQGETWNDGDVLYLSPTTAGAITNIKPTAPNHTVILGYVVYAHAVNGKIFVKCDNGYELGELHDCYLPTPSNNDGIFWNSTNLRYENKSVSSSLGYTPANAATTLTINGVTYDLSTSRTWTISAGISGSGASGQVAYWTGASAQSGSNNLFWDNANGRLGIGLNNPADSLHLNTGGVRIQNIRASLDNFYTAGVVNGLKIQNTTTNGRTLLGLVPNGTSTLADFWVFNTSDTTTNYSALAWGYELNSTFWGINSISAGTGQTRPIYINATNGQAVASSNISFFTNGNVGIGTGSTNGGQRLQVQGTTLLNGNVTFSSATGMFWDATNSRLGIGTNAPAVNLDVAGTNPGGIVGFKLRNASSNGYTEIQCFNNGGTVNDRMYMGIGGTATGDAFQNRGYFFSGSNLDGINFTANKTSTGDIRFFTGGVNERMRIFGNGNLALGSTTDSGERLQVTGNTKIVGSGNTSATTALTVQNSDGTNVLRARNEGRIFLGSSSTSIYPMDKSTTSISLSGNGLSFFDTSATSGDTFYFTGSDYTHTSGIARLFNATRLFWPTSGSGSLVMFNISPNINQTGGANGITRGLYVNPTLTSAADFRAIETARGNVVFGNLPTSSAGLPTGAIWNDAGTLKIV